MLFGKLIAGLEKPLRAIFPKSKVGERIGGTVLVETVFARAGIGRVTLAAIQGRDLPVVMAVIMLSAVVFVVVHLLVELAYPLLDPRLRRGVKTR